MQQTSYLCAAIIFPSIFISSRQIIIAEPSGLYNINIQFSAYNKAIDKFVCTCFMT